MEPLAEDLPLIHEGIPQTVGDSLSLWAKSPPDGDPGSGYPLLLHLLDVAAVASRLQQLIPCPVRLPCSPDWISALVGLHDLGKATPGFQKKLGLDFPDAAGAPDRHDAGTVPLLRKKLLEIGVKRCFAHQLAMAVGSHHGSLITSEEIRCAGGWQFSVDWIAAHDELFIGIVEGIAINGVPDLPDDDISRSAFLQWLMGLTSVADWIGSSDAICRWDRLDTWNGDVKAWFSNSLDLAELALIDIGIASKSFNIINSGAEAVALALDGWSPRPLQLSIVEVLDQLENEPGLIVIEAPMGEGKTEGGLACALSSRGLYMAMPTQATSNALFGRVSKFLDRAVSGSSALALAHGSGGPEAAANRLREVGLGTKDSGITAGWWFRGSKRSLLCPNGIGTVDQSLIGVLNARHQFVRMFGLSGRTVVFDELHAYDTYTEGLIERLLLWLQCLGCRVVIMSATLPNARRDSILKAWAGDVPIPTTSYPRVTWATPGRIQALAFPASCKQEIEVRGIGADLVVDKAVDMAKQGARVLMVVNKVDRAQEIYQAVDAVPRTLFHARFPMDQRLLTEKSVLKQFGPSGSCTAGHVLVATQVAEQSLDIDMDVLITDIAPVDLVLQRAGRIHRHERKRPVGFERPLVLVAGLDQQVPPPKLTSYIYDQWSVLRSAAWLKEHSSLDLPEDIDRAVQQVYGNWEVTGSDQLLEAIATAWPTHQQEQARMELLASQTALNPPQDWGMHNSTVVINDADADSADIQFGTRLGQQSVSVIPVYPFQLGNLSAHADFLSGHYLRISHNQLISSIRGRSLPSDWFNHPGLRHKLPLVLDVDGSGSGCRLDTDLGLVIG